MNTGGRFIDLDDVTEEAAKAAFRQAQSVYRGEYDHFPLTNTWDSAGENVRDSWRKIAAAACGARKFDALKLEYAIAGALAPYFEEGFTARDGAQAVMRLLSDRALSALGDEAKKSEGVQSAYGEYTPITVRASTTPSDPTADVADITRVIYETLPSFNWDECEKAARAVHAFTVGRR